MSKKPNPDRPTESQIPAFAKTATGRAYKDAVSSGKRVLIAKDGNVVQVGPNGTSQVVTKTASPTTVAIGSKRTLKK